jgi:hypothetical protein
MKMEERMDPREMTSSVAALSISFDASPSVRINRAQLARLLMFDALAK